MRQTKLGEYGKIRWVSAGFQNNHYVIVTDQKEEEE
jgi:hypothetical protein